jgi:hypothetical protein
MVKERKYRETDATCQVIESGVAMLLLCRVGILSESPENTGFSRVFQYQWISPIEQRRENVGLVRFELTIDGSLRHASVLQRVIIVSTQETHCSSSAKHKERKDRWSPSPYRARPQPRSVAVRTNSFPDSIKSQCINLRVVLFTEPEGCSGRDRRIKTE